MESSSVAQLERELAEAKAEIEKLRTRLAWFERKFYQRSSEKLSEQELQQLRLFDEAESIADDPSPQHPEEESKSPVAAHERRRPKRRAIPAELPREEILLDIPDEDKQCGCGHQLVRIGEEVSEKLDIIPPQVKVLRYVRPKYACKACEGSGDEDHPAVRTASMPATLIPKGIATPGLLAYMVSGKFCDGLPLYRQQKQFARIGIELPRQTLSDWMIQVAHACEPVYQALLERVRSGPVLQMDETPVQVMREPERKNTTKSYMWVMRGGPPGQPGVVYHYADSRAAQVARTLCADYEGHVQTDGYDGYDSAFAENTKIIHVGCMAHARRTFIEAKAVANTPSLDEALAFIAKLYAVEKQLAPNRGQPQFLEQRKALATPILEKFKRWLDKKAVQVPPASALGKAAGYCIGQWHKLVRYLDSPYLTPDTNAIERAIRPFVIGRKAWLLSGSPRGASASALLYSLVETARENNLEPYGYLRMLFEKLPLARIKDDYRALLPGG